MLSRSTQSAGAEAEADAHAGRRAVAAHRRAAARPASSAGIWDARLKAPRRRGRDQRGADGVIELALEQGVGGRFQGSSPARARLVRGHSALAPCPGTRRRSRCRSLV
jgi:hypothetical protein